MSFEQSISNGGLVVNTSGGRYSGGGMKEDIFTMVPGSSKVSVMLGVDQWIGGLVVALLLLVIVFFMWGTITSLVLGSSSGFESGHPNKVRFATGASDNVSRFSQEDRAAEYYNERQSGFINAREQPYFPDVTNRVLRMENREKEAVRALGKINQERLRRASEDTSSTTPLPWGPFWKEWKQTHVMDGEDVASGFESEFERRTANMAIY
jgi:hypothetical protein